MESINHSKFDDIIKRSLTLRNIIESFKYLEAEQTEKKDKTKITKRLNDVLSFIYDLDFCLQNGTTYLKKNKYFVLVTGSRVVKLIKIHIDIIICELSIKYGLEHKVTFFRSIENKRMPSKVSATNITGDLAPTMTKESIVVLKKQ